MSTRWNAGLLRGPFVTCSRENFVICCHHLLVHFTLRFEKAGFYFQSNIKPCSNHSSTTRLECSLQAQFRARDVYQVSLTLDSSKPNRPDSAISNALENCKPERPHSPLVTQSPLRTDAHLHSEHCSCTPIPKYGITYKPNNHIFLLS